MGLDKNHVAPGVETKLSEFLEKVACPLVAPWTQLQVGLWCSLVPWESGRNRQYEGVPPLISVMAN